jgi:excisionase family DNA binding protein
MTEKLAYSPSEAAKLVGIGRTKLYAEARANRITIRKSQRKSLILRSDLENWLRALPEKGIRSGAPHTEESEND